MIIGQKSMEIDIGRQYVSNSCPKSKKINPWPPKPLNIDIGQSFPTSGSIESFKKSRATPTLLLSIFAKLQKNQSSPGPEILCFTVMKWLDACQLCQKVMQSKRLKLLLNLEPTFLNNDETCADFACTEMFSTQVMASLLMTIMLDATMSDENKE